MKDYYYYRKGKITAEELFKIERNAIEEAVEKNTELFFAYFLLLPTIVAPGVLVFRDFPIILSKN